MAELWVNGPGSCLSWASDLADDPGPSPPGRLDRAFVSVATRCWSDARSGAVSELQMKQESSFRYWAEDGFCTLVAQSAQYEAALMCTELGEGVGDLVFPARTILVRVLTLPDYNRAFVSCGEAVAHDGSEASLRMTVRSTQKMTCIDSLWFGKVDTSFAREVPIDPVSEAILDDGRTMLEAFTAEGRWSAARPLRPEESRAMHLIRRLTVGLLLAYRERANFLSPTATSSAKRLRGMPPNHRVAFLGAPVRCDFTREVREHVDGTRRRGAPAFQYVVRGHYKRQVTGPGRVGRKIIWIQPYWRGPEEAVILARPHKV